MGVHFFRYRAKVSCVFVVLSSIKVSLSYYGNYFNPKIGKSIFSVSSETEKNCHCWVTFRQVEQKSSLQLIQLKPFFLKKKNVLYSKRSSGSTFSERKLYLRLSYVHWRCFLLRLSKGLIPEKSSPRFPLSFYRHILLFLCLFATGQSK